MCISQFALYVIMWSCAHGSVCCDFLYECVKLILSFRWRWRFKTRTVEGMMHNLMTTHSYRIHVSIAKWLQFNILMSQNVCGLNVLFCVAYVGFAAAAGQVEIERNPELPEGLEVVPETFSRKLPQRILVPLSRFFYLPFLRKHTWNNTAIQRDPESKRERSADLIQQVSLLHESLQENDENVWFGGGHGPGSVTCDGRTGVSADTHTRTDSQYEWNMYLIAHKEMFCSL